MDFIAIDVETANPDLSSICQIGMVYFERGFIKHSWQSLINPEDYFDAVNVSIHGIDENNVKKAPIFPQIYDFIKERIGNNIVVSHTSFDRVAFKRVIEKYGLDNINCSWLDSARVVRRTWSECAGRGYGLKNIAEKLSINFIHHNAEEDARAAGEILIRAIQETGLTVIEWLDRVKRPILWSDTRPGRGKEGNPQGPLFGEVIVFTGALEIPRREAAQIAADAGCEVSLSVKKGVTILIVGDHDIRKLAGHKKSSKRRKAEELIAKGESIRILCESDFRQLVELT